MKTIDKMIAEIMQGKKVKCPDCDRIWKPNENRDCNKCLEIESEIRFRQTS